jgi:hypothetical protein
MVVANTLAYYDTATVTAVKKFYNTGQAPMLTNFIVNKTTLKLAYLAYLCQFQRQRKKFYNTFLWPRLILPSLRVGRCPGPTFIRTFLPASWLASTATSSSTIPSSSEICKIFKSFIAIVNGDDSRTN